MDACSLTRTHKVLYNHDMATTKEQTAVRFSAEAQQLLAELVSDTGLSQSAIMELAVRDMARARGITLPASTVSPDTADEAPIEAVVSVTEPTSSLPSRVMERVRAYSRKSGRKAEEGMPPESWTMVNTTSRANAMHWGRAFSPMLLGPVPLYCGMTSRTLEAAWQFSKVYRQRAIQYCERHQAMRGPACRTEGCKRFTPRIEEVDHIGTDGLPNENWWRWARVGWEYEVDPADSHSREYLRRPMGSGVKAAYSYWDGQRYSYIEGRKDIYIPLYVAAATKLPAWEKLKRLYEGREHIRLYDVDGRNLYNTGQSYEEALNDPSHPFGHSLVLAALLEGVDLSRLNVWECNRFRDKPW